MNRWTQMRSRLHKKHGRSAGFTLVEMLVAFSILGVALIAIGGFLITGVRSYNSVSAETNVQNEAQIAMTQIQDTIMNASLGVSYNVQTTGTDHFVENDSDSDLSGLTPTSKYIYVFNWNNDRSTVEALIIKYDISARKLYFYEKSGLAHSSSGTPQTIAEAVDVDSISGWELLAEGVDSFEIDMSKYQTTRQITSALTLSKSGKSYSTDVIITLRNDVLINPNNIDDVYDRVDAVINTVITGVDLTVSSYSMVRGGTVQLTTKVLGTGYPSQRIYQWKIESVSGVSVTKDADGKISINGENSGNLTELYDSLKQNNSGTAAVDVSTKVLSLITSSSDDLLKVTATVYAGEDASHNPIYKSDSEYIAIKDISNFSIWPDPESKTTYSDNNAELAVPNNGFPAASYSQGIGTTVPVTGETNPNNSMDVYPNNIIDMKASLTGTNLDESDKGVIWSVHSTSEVGNISISSSGVLTINRYAQQGWAIISACPVLDSSMVLYYMVRIGNQYATTSNALTIGGEDTINRGGSTQFTLKLNGHDMSRLEDFNWSYKIYDSSNRQITDTTTSLTNAGFLTAGTTLSYDYSFNIEINVSMKSNPDVKASKTITVPRVTLTMTEPTIISKRGTVIPEGTTRCIVTGLEVFDLEWTLASQTNPNYRNSSLPNGSWITNAGDTCTINISGSEPQTLTYMRARATLAGYSNYYAETYLSLADVSLSVTGNTEVQRGGSAALTVKLNPADAGISTASTDWSIVSVVDANGANASMDGLSLSVSRGSGTSLEVASTYYRSSTDIRVTVKAVLNGISATYTVKVKASEKFTISADEKVNRGGTAQVKSNYGTEVVWEITEPTNSDRDQLILTNDADGNLSIMVPAYFDLSNSNPTITVKGTVPGTNLGESCEIDVNPVSLNKINSSNSSGNRNNYNCSTSIKSGFNNPNDPNECMINWAISGSDNKNARSTTYNGIKIDGASNGSSVNIDVSGKNSGTNEFWVVAYVTVKNASGDVVEIKQSAVTEKITLVNLKTFNEVRNLSYRNLTIRVSIDKQRKWSGGNYYNYRIVGSVADDNSTTTKYFRVTTQKLKNKSYSDYQDFYPNGNSYIYLALTQDGTWYYLDGGSNDKTWKETVGASMNEVFHVSPTNSSVTVAKIVDTIEALRQEAAGYYYFNTTYYDYVD